MDAAFAAQALAQKALARRNRTVRNLVLLAGALLGIMTGIVWFVLAPTEAPKPQYKLALGVFCGALMAYQVGRRLLRLSARCPNCDYDWEIKEGRYVQPDQQMPNWSNCPGCGIDIRDAPLNEAVKS